MKATNNYAADRRNRFVAALMWLAATILLAGCGGGSGSGASQHSASVTYPSSTFVFVVGSAITPVVPTASPALSSFIVSPALPAGLSLNSSNGTISGTPTASSAAATYTVSASGGGATATASVSITVNPAPPSSVSYGAAAFTFTTNIAANTLRPTAGGGAVTSWSIDPALPAALIFDTTTGAISGTPTAASAATSYVVTAQNAGGQATVPLTIEVDSGVLLDVGHESAIAVIRISGSSVLSLDQSGHWNLWDYTSGSEIASGNLYCAPNCDQLPATARLADMAGGTIALATQNGFEFLSSTTGQAISSITASVSWWSLASDGSYLAAGSSSGLSAWSPSGSSLVSLSGDYSKALAFAAPGQIQVAAGPAGQNVIQTVSVPGGTSTTGPAFNGTFSSWFLDGSRFITTAGTSVLVYSPASVLQATMVFTSTTPFVGQGNWVWTVAGYGGQLQIFPIVSSSAPVASLTIASAYGEVPSGKSLAVETGDQTGFEVIDLSGSTLSETPYINYSLSAYAATSTSQWMFGNRLGVLLDGASLGGSPRYFDYGAVSSIAGSSGFIAVATASGRIVYFDASTLAQEGVISVSASNLVLSSDGSVLAAEESGGPIGIYSLPAATLLYTWSYPPAGGVTAGGIGLSGSGAILTQALSPASGPVALEAAPAQGGSPTFSTTVTPSSQGFAPQILVSPNGTLFATTSGVLSSGANPGTDLWNNGSLTTAVTGDPLGWVDDGHLLVNTYSYPFPGAPAAVYAGCNVYSPSGQSTGSCSLPRVSAFDAVTSDLIYAINLAEIVSVSTGNVSWMSADSALQPDSAPPSIGAVAGTHVIFPSGSTVLAQGY